MERFLNFIRAWFLERLSEEKGQQFLSELNRTPPEATPEEVAESPAWDMGSAGTDFMAQMAARGGAGRISIDGVRNVEAGDAFSVGG